MRRFVNASELAGCHSTAAAAEIETVYRLYEKERARLGAEFLEAVDKLVRTIAENPERFKIIRKDVRRAVLRRFLYSILYRIVSGHIVVIACFHSKRNPKVWRRRE